MASQARMLRSDETSVRVIPKAGVAFTSSIERSDRLVTADASVSALGEHRARSVELEPLYRQQGEFLDPLSEGPASFNEESGEALLGDE